MKGRLPIQFSGIERFSDQERAEFARYLVDIMTTGKSDLRYEIDIPQTNLVRVNAVELAQHKIVDNLSRKEMKNLGPMLEAARYYKGPVKLDNGVIYVEKNNGNSQFTVGRYNYKHGE